MKLRCKLGWHNYITFRSFSKSGDSALLRSIHRYETRCWYCGQRRR